MKIVVLCLVVLSAVACVSAGYREYQNACLDENGLTKEEFYAMKRNQDPRSGCVTACIMKKNGSMKHGIIDARGIKRRMRTLLAPFISKDKLYEKIDYCVDEAENHVGVCEKAYVLQKCLRTPRANNVQGERQKMID
ncbi:uncharacterized protein LOC100119441 precursor [Nasonia vitripennis]|uniref:Odorant binding protein n=1 Tax=Nasonia vitripennis TaxID=7425 RepID=G8B1T2_NASVI|nr:uncharacterized protein LOC100119441 precursor [Nasonia vitripennis]ADK73604.1 odorant binding protein [Nasonia vitripennis]CCD17846.1 putative odorant binding protein 77 [Nasonia vitripennis]